MKRTGWRATYFLLKDRLYWLVVQLGPLRWCWRKAWNVLRLFNSSKRSHSKLGATLGWDDFKWQRWKTHWSSKIYASTTYCPLPWMHLSVSSSGETRLCCNNEGVNQIRKDNGEALYFSEVKNLTTFFNNNFFKQVRLAMLEGRKHPACKKCYDHEASGSMSARQSFLFQFKDEIKKSAKNTEKDGGLKKIDVQYVDFAMGNNCNIRCRMCNPKNSRLLAKDFSKMGRHYNQQDFENANATWGSDNYQEDIYAEAFKTTTDLLITGGEPFIIKSHFRMLEKAIEMGRASQINLTYHTNLTILPKSLPELWKHFKHVRVHGSIEAVGDLNDYIRYPSRWERVDQTLRQLLELKKELPLWVEVHSVFQAYSLSRTTELLEYLLQFRDQMPSFPFFNYLYEPQPLQVNVLPLSIRQKYATEIRSFIEKNESLLFAKDSPYLFFNRFNYDIFKGYIDLMLNRDEEERWGEFLDYSHKMDQVHKKDLKTVLPELFL